MPFSSSWHPKPLFVSPHPHVWLRTLEGFLKPGLCPRAEVILQTGKFSQQKPGWLGILPKGHGEREAPQWNEMKSWRHDYVAREIGSDPRKMSVSPFGAFLPVMHGIIDSSGILLWSQNSISVVSSLVSFIITFLCGYLSLWFINHYLWWSNYLIPEHLKWIATLGFVQT